jgi:phosphoglycolate phosphatase
MDKLLLFDIDSTLVRNTPAHDDAFKHAFKEVYDVDARLIVKPTSGLTDQHIIMEVLKNCGLSRAQVLRHINACMASMVAYFESVKDTCEPPTVLPGVPELLEVLARKGHLLGLVTGNLQPIARMKLARVGLDRYFPLGGFGDDHADRAELVKLAMRRAREAHDFSGDAYLFGDTPRDVAAGRKARATTVATATGKFSAEQLREAGADYVVEGFSDTQAVLQLVR